MTPEERSARARKAGLAAARKRWGFELSADDPRAALVEARASGPAAGDGSPVKQAVSASQVTRERTALQAIVVRGSEPNATVGELVTIARDGLGEVGAEDSEGSVRPAERPGKKRR